MPLDRNMPLFGEIPNKDFDLCAGEISSEKVKYIFRKVGMDGAWLRDTISGGKQWVNDEELSHHKKQLAKFFNEEATCPFYVRHGFVNSRDTLSFIFFDQADQDAFITKFGKTYHYKTTDNGFQKNLETMSLRFQKLLWLPQDRRLMPYLEMALKS